MNIHYNKYLKYKNKYINLLQLTKNVSTFKGGALFNIASELKHTDINDEFNILMYHGILVEITFKIPDNIILIVSDCCGVANFESQFVWYDPFIQNADSLNKTTLAKSDMIQNINGGKIIINKKNYNVLKPGSIICDFKLETIFDDIAVGHHIKKFGDTPLYDTKLILTNKIKFTEIFKMMKEFFNWMIQHDVYSFEKYIYDQYRLYQILYIKESFDIQILLYIFHMKYGETLFLKYNSDNIAHFLDNLSYDYYNCFKTKISTYKFELFVKEMYCQRSRLIERLNKDLTNYNILLFILFYTLIKKNPETSMLSEKLNNISDENKVVKTVVLLYACQGNKQMCVIDNCYKRFHGMEIDTYFMITFIDDIKKNLNKDKYVKIIDDPPQISINIKSDNLLERDLSIRIDDAIIADFYDFETFNIFINLFYDIINNTKRDHERDPEVKIGKLVRPNGNIISLSTLTQFYGSNYTILLLLIDNSSYYATFKDLFVVFIGILKKYIEDKITVQKFLSSLTILNEGKYKLYDEIIEKYNNHPKFFVPNDINNKTQLDKLFETIMINSDDKTAFCNDIGGFLTTNSGILDDLDIFIMSSYSGHKTVSFYNLNELVIASEYKNLKIKYIEYLIKQHGCKELISKAKIISTPSTPSTPLDAWD
jgi:hypothetical protein